MLGALGGYCLQVPLPHDQVCAALHLDLVLVLRIEQHPVTDLHGADVVADPIHLTQVADQLGRRASSLSPARDSLLKKGLVYSAERGQIAFTVPHFGRFVLGRLVG